MATKKQKKKKTLHINRKPRFRLSPSAIHWVITLFNYWLRVFLFNFFFPPKCHNPFPLSQYNNSANAREWLPTLLQRLSVACFGSLISGHSANSLFSPVMRDSGEGFNYHHTIIMCFGVFQYFLSLPAEQCPEKKNTVILRARRLCPLLKSLLFRSLRRNKLLNEKMQNESKCCKL